MIFFLIFFIVNDKCFAGIRALVCRLKESLFSVRLHGSTTLPHHTQLADGANGIPLSLEKPAILLVNMNV